MEMEKKNIIKRSMQAIEDLVDLNDHYTSSLDDSWFGKSGDDLSSFPKGIQAYEKAAFDVRGLIQLAGKNSREQVGNEFPLKVEGIQANVPGFKIHFLQGTRGIAADDTVVGKYVLHYDDGNIVTVPVIYGRNVKDFWAKKNDSTITDADLVWVGKNEYTAKEGFDIRLYKQTINNPFPDGVIKTIDLVSEMAESAPFVVAITVDRAAGFSDQNYEWFDAIKISNPIIDRDPKASVNQVDLSNYYHASLDDDWFNHPGHDLHDVPKGLQEFGGVTFDVRGLIATGCRRSLRVSGLALPEEVSGIKVGCRGKKISFLHFAAFGPMAEGADRTIGKYVIHYANGDIKNVPIVYQENTLDWWIFEEGDVTDPNAIEAWTGSNAATRGHGMKTRLIKYTWDNPLPDEKIENIDLISSVENAAPLLVAITVEA